MGDRTFCDILRCKRCHPFPDQQQQQQLSVLTRMSCWGYESLPPPAPPRHELASDLERMLRRVLLRMSWVQDQTAWLHQLETASGTLSQLELCFDTMADEHQLRAKASLSLESLSQGQQQAAQLLLNQTALEMKLHEQQLLNTDLSKRLRN